MSKNQSGWRQLSFQNLAEALAECESLAASGYQRHGNWSLGQICRHLTITQNGNLDGYPKWMAIFAPVRPVMRWLILPRLLSGESIKGLPTAKVFVPPENLEDQKELEEFSASVYRFCSYEGKLHPHPGFGRMKREEMERIHAAHAAHHLGFLSPAVDSSDD